DGIIDDEGDDNEPEWDPTESEYQDIGAEEEEDDLEGEEWKYGLEPGERVEPEWAADAQKEWEQDQKRYDEPDQRAREVDWSERGRELLEGEYLMDNRVGAGSIR